ncbi:MAG: PTS transporter subunit EIIC [Tetragenococcus koreensis]|nr:PTS transporter subunit EIIC [Tetragenococcus koreensis]
MNSKFMNKFVEIASKIGNQVHLRSLRDAFATIIPMFILAGLAVLINNVLFPFIFSGETLTVAQDFGNSINNGTLNIAGLLLCPTIAYFLSSNKGFANPISAAVVAMATYITIMPLAVDVPFNESTIETTGALTYENLGTEAMFVGIIIGLVATEVLLALNKTKVLRINLGEQVPPAVSKSFSTMLPAIITVSLFAALSLLLQITLNMDLITLIVTLIQQPLRAVGASLLGYLFLYSFGNLLFTFGIHQSVINGPFTEPFLTQNINENMIAYSQGTEPPNILTISFQTSFAQMGGTGATICLLIAILIFSRMKSYREMAKLSLAPGLFEINEPVIFGLPIVFNIPMIIPFVIIPIIQTLIAYAVTALGWISKTVVFIPWVTPPVISGYLATAGDWRAPILQIILIALGVIIYLPFLKISERVLKRQAEMNS